MRLWCGYGRGMLTMTLLLGTSPMRSSVTCNGANQPRHDRAGTWARRTLHLGWWVARLTPVILIPSCCDTVTSHGDASLSHSRLDSGLLSTVGALTFPEFAIDQRQTFWFRVRDLPRPYVPNELDVLRRREDDAKGTPWTGAVITLRLHAPEGPPIAQLVIELASLTRWIADDDRVSYYVGSEWALGSGVGTSYDLEVEISQPSPRAGDRAVLYGRETGGLFRSRTSTHGTG